MYKIIKEFKSPIENADYLYLVESYDNYYLIFKTLNNESDYYFSEPIHIDLKLFFTSMVEYIEGNTDCRNIKDFQFTLFSYINFNTIEIDYILDNSYVCLIELDINDLLEYLPKLI